MSCMQEKIRKQQTQAYVDIDVGKDHLDIYIHPVGTGLKIENDKSAIQKLIRKLKQYNIQLITLEATSKYHRPPASITG